jgi:MSHA pilin protein MshC
MDIRWLVHRSGSRGFTLIELTVVIVLVAIVSVVAMARLTGVDSFKVQGFADSARSTVRFAQKLAVAQRIVVVVVVNVGAGSMSVCYINPACATPVTDPTTGGAMVIQAPNGASIAGPVSICFDGLGRATPGGTITVSGAGINSNFVIESETGYVHL